MQGYGACRGIIMNGRQGEHFYWKLGVFSLKGGRPTIGEKEGPLEVLKKQLCHLTDMFRRP